MHEQNVIKTNLRNFYMPQEILRKYITNTLSYINLKIKSKNFLITKEMLDSEFLIYTGRAYYSLKIKHDMLGHKVGEFIVTRQFLRQYLKKRLKLRSKYRRKRIVKK